MFLLSMTCCNGLLINYDWQTTLLSHRGVIQRNYWLPLKAIDFYGVDSTNLLKKIRGSIEFVHI